MNERPATPQHLLQERMSEIRIEIIPLCMSALGSSAEILTTLIMSDLSQAEHALESGDVGKISKAYSHLVHYPI